MERITPHASQSVLKCCQCGKTYTDHRLSCDDCPQALLRTVYATGFPPFKSVSSHLKYLNAKAVVAIGVSDNLQGVRDPAITVRESTERG